MDLSNVIDKISGVKIRSTGGAGSFGASRGLLRWAVAVGGELEQEADGDEGEMCIRDSHWPAARAGRGYPHRRTD